MKILRISLLTLFAILLAASSVSAQEVPPCVPPPCPQGSACPMYACPIHPPIGEALKIDYHRVNVKIENQIAHTTIDMKFENDGYAQAEGSWIFPLPIGASVDSLTMYINDQPIKAQVLDANDAQAQYDAIVRQYRDPVLLKYIGTQAVQANIFPIPPGESRRITLTYTQALEVDNGLIHYVYPFNVTRLTSARPVEDASISVDVTSNDPVSNIYSPSHSIVINRSDDTHFNVGWEQSDYIPDQDFSLYYGIASNTINVNMLTYRDSASSDGFFMMMVQPPIATEGRTPPQDTVIPRDIIVVLDQSGSMQGDKWNQAQQAADYILNHLNSGDRFNVILFSTGWRLYANSLQSSDNASDAANWIDGQDADGGTDINGALATALGMTDRERPTTILFMTDGLPTEGETDAQQILKNVDSEAGSNVSLFTFGVGDDVNTTLLDSLSRDHHGTSSYVRPNERIDEVVASLYSKIGSPVLTNVKLSVSGDAVLDTMYPSTPLPDLFAGNQLTIVGRYHGSADNISVTLSGNVAGKDQSFTYSNLDLRQNAGGDPFIARLWATRRIGDLLNTIRLDGESPELVQSVVELSVRYGIITPYTSFLISDQDVLTQSGRQAAQDNFSQTAQQLQSQVSGAGAVDAASAAGSLQEANAPAPMLLALPTATAGGTGGVMVPQGQVANGAPQEQQAQTNPIQTVGGKTFIYQNNVWTDTTFTPDTMTTQKVVFLSDDYFKLLADKPELTQYFSIGDHVIVVLDGTAYEVTAS